MGRIITIEEFEKKKEKPGWQQRMRGIGEEEFSETEFQKTYEEMATKMGLSLDPDDPRHFYDYRALYKETGKLEPDETGHFPSKYKKEGHPRMVIDKTNTKTGKPVGELTLEKTKDIKIPEMPPSEIDILNESIEKNYKEYLKLQTTLSEFDTSLSEIPDIMKPTIIANYNKGVNKFNSLISGLQADIAKRDQIISAQKQEFKEKKLTTEQMSPLAQNLLSGRVSKADESDIKDIADAFILGGSKILQQSKDYFINALPNMIFRDLTVEDTVSQYAGMTQSKVDKLNIENRKKLKKYDKAYLRSQQNYYKWLKENPELQPREEWAEGVIASVKKDPTILLDPAYWAYVAADSASFTIGVMGTTYGVTVATGNPLLGMAAGVAVATPMQTQDLYEDLIASGATPEQAGKLAAPIGGLIASVEVMGDLPILASISKPFKKMLTGKIRKTVANKVVAKLLQSKITTFATIEASETLEEIVQAGLQDACVMTVDENRKFLGDLAEIAVATPMATLPFALFGISADINAQNKAKAQIKARIDKLINDRLLRDVIKIQLEEQGMIPKEPKVVTEAYKAEPKEPTELFKDIDAYTKTEEGHEFKVMRSGEEYSDSSRGGTWYEIETWKGKKSAYLEGQGQYGLPGVGGKVTIRKELILKNPYMFEIPETKAEGEIPMKLWEEVEEKTLPSKKGFFGKDAEKHFAKLEKEVSDTLKEKGYDGVVLYEKVGINTYPKQIFDLKAEPKEPTTPEELEAKREMLRKRGVKEELLTDEFVKKATVKVLEKADVTGETLELTEAQKKIQRLREAKKEGKLEPTTAEKFEEKWKGAKEKRIEGEKVEKPKAEVKEPVIPKEEVSLAKREVKPEVKIEEPPKVSPIPPKEVALEEKPEFRKDIKIKDVYTIGERTPAKKVKGKIREITGQTKQDKILIAELDILDLVLKGEAKGARKAFSEGKKKGIFDLKEHFEEILNRARERKAQKEYVNKLIKDINKLPTEKVAIDYKDKIQDIKDMFDLKKRQEKTLHAREETAKFIEREMAKGDTDLRIPQKEIDLIRKISLNDMTIQELETVHDDILHLAHIGKTKGKLIKLADKRATDKLVEELTDTILQGDKITSKQKGYHTKVKGLKEKFGDVWNLYFVNTKLDEALLEEIDGMEKGINWKTVFKSVNNSNNQELKSHFKEVEDYMDFLTENKIDFVKFMTDKKQYGDSEFTSAEKVGVYLASLDVDARRHIQRSDTLDISDKDIEAVTTLTKEEKAFADYLTKYFLRQGEAIDKILVNTEGKHLRRVKNYYPCQVLSEELNNDAIMDLENNPMRKRAYLDKDFQKERTKHAISAININSVSTFLRNLATVEHWKAYTETTRDLNKILFDPKFKEAIKQKKGKIVYNNLIKWFKDAVDAKQGKILSDADKVMMFLRTNAAISMLGINVVSSMRQLVSLCNATAEIGLPAILNGIRQVSLSHAETKQFVFQRDEQMKRRHYQFEQVFSEQLGQIMAGKTVEGISKRQAKDILKKLQGKPELKKQMLFLIRMFDEFAVLSVWKGSYDKAINQGKSENEAIEYAGAVMRKTQPMVALKDLPQWFREGGVVQLFNMFQNQINKNWNYINHDIFGKFKHGKISPYTAAHRLLWGWFVPSILLGMISRGRRPKDWKEIVQDVAVYYLGGVFFIGAFAINAIRGYGGYTSPVLAFGSDIVKAATYKTTESKLKHGISASCKVFGVPYNQPYRTIEGLEDWINGETEDARRLIWTKYVLGEEEKKVIGKGKYALPEKTLEKGRYTLPKKSIKKGKYALPKG